MSVDLKANFLNGPVHAPGSPPMRSDFVLHAQPLAIRSATVVLGSRWSVIVVYE